MTATTATSRTTRPTGPAPRKPRNPQKPHRTRADQHRRAAETLTAESDGTAAQIRRHTGTPVAPISDLEFCGCSREFRGSSVTTDEAAGHATPAQGSADSAVSAAAARTVIDTRRGRRTEPPTLAHPRAEKLTIAELCADLKISRSTFYDWRAKGRAPRCIKLPNGDLRIRRSDYENWLDTRGDAA